MPLSMRIDALYCSQDFFMTSCINKSINEFIKNIKLNKLINCIQIHEPIPRSFLILDWLLSK